VTDEQIDQVFNAMPRGAQGFLVDWGYRQFAHALLEAAGIDFEAQRERFEFVHGLCRDAQDIGSRYGWGLHFLATVPVPADNEMAAYLQRTAKHCLAGGLGVPMAERSEPQNARLSGPQQAEEL